MVYALPLVVFVLSLIAARWALLQRLGYTVLAAALLVVGAALWAIWAGRQQTGWDGIGYAIFAVLVCGPVLLGAGVGALLGWLRRRRG
ncbi:hypothetical protein ACOXXX_07240 [Thalassococcus sp. BH17M4-6]|uniref:hypothetical protein n=1 Tax=Thalassococcus sp. BH17M4-6 TaxID=3413148 RepID=UPI003BCA0EF2